MSGPHDIGNGLGEAEARENTMPKRLPFPKVGHIWEGENGNYVITSITPGWWGRAVIKYEVLTDTVPTS